MSRPLSNALAYFPLVVGFFQDEQIQRLSTRFGPSGPSMLLYIMCRAYKTYGYYTVWDSRLEEDIARDLHITFAKIGLILNYMLAESLLKGISVSGVTILTSHGIQLQYQQVMKDRKREVEVDAALWILKKSETLGFVVLRPDGLDENKSGKNTDKSGINSDKSGKNPDSKNKEKSKVKTESIYGSDAEEEEAFKRFWEAYPKKYYEAEARKAFKAVNVPVKTLLAAIEQQKKSRQWQQENGRYIEYPSNWLRRCGWENQVDEERPEARVDSAQAKDIENMKRLYDSMKSQ